jgi:hypothetical protein
MPHPGAPAENRDYQINIVRIEQFPNTTANPEIIAQILGRLNRFSFKEDRLGEMRALVGKTLNREEFVEFCGLTPKMPIELALELFDDLYGPS